MVSVGPRPGTEWKERSEHSLRGTEEGQDQEIKQEKEIRTIVTMRRAHRKNSCDGHRLATVTLPRP